MIVKCIHLTFRYDVCVGMCVLWGSQSIMLNRKRHKCSQCIDHHIRFIHPKYGIRLHDFKHTHTNNINADAIDFWK